MGLLEDLSEFKTLSLEDINKEFTNNNFFGKSINNEEYRSPFMDQRNIPLGESFMDNSDISVFPGTGKDEEGKQGYHYNVETIPCESGSMVYEKYENTKEVPHILNLFYEKNSKGKNNFFGNFYIAQMGSYHITLANQFPTPLPAKINGTLYKNLTSLKDEAGYLSQVAYSTNGDKLDSSLVYLALMREYDYKIGNTKFQELIGNIESIPQDALNWCAEQIGKIIPDEKNYEPSHENYSPFIPLPIVGLVPVNLNKAAQYFEDIKSNPFVQGVENAFSTAWNLITNAASKVKDAVIDHLPDPVKNLIQKISDIVNQIKVFLTDIENVIKEFLNTGLETLKILNAFVCGIISGLISLIQCIIYLLAFICSPTVTFSYKQSLERRAFQEKIEDVIDFIKEHTSTVFNAIKSLLSSGDTEGINDLYSTVANFIGGLSTYKKAYYAGCIVFEIIINILLLVFTEGAGNLVKGTTYLQKAQSLLKVILKETISVVTLGLADLLTLLGRIILRFAKACQQGFKSLALYIEELISGMRNGSKLDNLAQEATDLDVVTAPTIGNEIRKVKGLIAQDIKNWLLSKYKISKAFLKLLEEIGISIFKNTDHNYAYALSERYILKFGDDNIFEGTGKALEKFSKKVDNIKASSGTGAVRRYVNERVAIANYVKLRKELKALKKPDVLLAKFKGAFIVKHFDAVDFFEKMVKKYPKLKASINELGEVHQINIAEFTIQKTKNGKFEKVDELYHSGSERFYEDDFIHPFEEGDTLTSTFQSGVSDITGAPRRRDSEVKFIFNFIRKHLDTADEFIIETKNIYFTCTSCQREMLMLKEYVESLGKKIEIIIHGDETILGGSELFKKIK
ncbi:hypothetical protein [Chryseobacterium sp. MEBOG07]|uniref:hypothetical protein n=1 Tax=Chryseobacterium sp. MEBOG07 TaxID=2879939 RepID=UPI001F44F47D|nr:hypothetical protein [Chryseobacterium sp. MEBOG07]UKB79459.1 hypothetical protein LF886_00185 [Chryseobacterium sp. MEBOG07]